MPGPRGRSGPSERGRLVRDRCGGAGRRDGLGHRLLAGGPDDEAGRARQREHRAEDRRPDDRGPRPGRRLLEGERVLGQDRPPDRDLGDRGGGGVTLLEQPRRQRSDEQPSRRHAVEPGEEDPDELEGERPPGAGRGVGRHAAAEIRADDERSRPDERGRPRAGDEPVGEGMVGQRPVRVDVPVDDLGDDVVGDDVDPLEGGDDGLLGRGERQGHRRQPGVGAPLGRGAVDRLAELGEPALAAGRGRLGGRLGRDPARRRRARSPERDVDALVVEPVGELADGRDAHLDDVDAPRRERGRLARAEPDARRGQRGNRPTACPRRR